MTPETRQHPLDQRHFYGNVVAVVDDADVVRLTVDVAVSRGRRGGRNFVRR